MSCRNSRFLYGKKCNLQCVSASRNESGEADILPEYQSNYSLSEMVGKLRDSSIAVCSYMEEREKQEQ